MKLTDEEHVLRNKEVRHLRKTKRNEKERERFNNYANTFRNKHITLYKFKNKKDQAIRRGIPFNITFEEILFPTHCPVLGIELDYGRQGVKGHRPNMPSFDRIDPSKGYVKGNVRVVSMKANTIKTNATPDEILAVGNYYKRLLMS